MIPPAEVEVVEETGRAHVLLDATRLALLDSLRAPGSAATLARRLELPRQRVNYHLRELERERLVECVEEKRRGSVVERIFRRSATTYAISPAALGPLGASPTGVQDRFSAAYQVALASRTVRELGALQQGAAAAGKSLATFALDTEVRFASPTERAAFAEELTAAVAALVERYHDEEAADGRRFRLHLGAHPRPREDG